MRNLKVLAAVTALSATLLLINAAAAQEKPSDKILMLNGEERIGSVTEIGEDFIKFSYAGESLTYTIKKQDINKIQYASGRIEFFNKGQNAPADQSAQAQQPSLGSHHNVVAILPFSYMGQGGERDSKMGLKVQSDCYSLLKRSANQMTFQDPITTNALLIKKGINESNIAGLTPSEVANILDVEYVLYGSVTIDQTGSTSSSGTYGQGKARGNNKFSGFSVGTTSTSNNYSTSVDMKIYNDHGDNIFDKTRQSFWPSVDAYEATLQFLIKRSPFYSK